MRTVLSRLCWLSVAACCLAVVKGGPASEAGVPAPAAPPRWAAAANPVLLLAQGNEMAGPREAGESVAPAASGEPTGDSVGSVASPRKRLSFDVDALATDWRRTAVFGALGLLAVLVLIYAVKMLFRVAVLVLCIVGGLAGTALLSAPMERLVGDVLPPIEGMHIRSDILGHIAAFLVGYLVSCVVMSVLLKPLHLARRRN